jgi:hypothetical protein
MKTHYRLVAALASALLLLTSIVNGVFAYDARVSIAPGQTLSASATSISMPAATFSLMQNSVSNGRIDVTATDLTGNYAGWKVTFEVSDFMAAGLPSIPDENLTLRRNQTGTVQQSGQSWIGTLSASPTALDNVVWTGAPTTFTPQGGIPGTGSTGSYTRRFDVSLMVPPGQPAGTYTSEITITIVAGN